MSPRSTATLEALLRPRNGRRTNRHGLVAGALSYMSLLPGAEGLNAVTGALGIFADGVIISSIGTMSFLERSYTGRGCVPQSLLNDFQVLLCPMGRTSLIIELC